MKQLFKPKLFPSKRIVAYDLIGMCVWTYGVTKLLIFDIDRWLIEATAPSLAWFLDFRLLIYLGLALGCLLFLGRKRFFYLCAYVVGFPFVVLFWKIPVVIIKIGNWPVRLAVINSLLSIFTDIIYKLVYFLVFFTSLALITFSNWTPAVVTGIVGITACVLSSFTKTIVDAFRTPRVLKFYSWGFKKVAADIYDKPSDLAPIDQKPTTLPAEIGEKYLFRLQGQVFTALVCRFFAERLQEYNESELHIVTGVLSIVRLIVLNVIAFAFVYFGVSKIDPAAVEGARNLSPFGFLYLSFDNMLFNSNSSARLLSDWSQAYSMLQRFLATLIGIIVLTTVVDIRRRRYAREIDDAIASAQRAADKVSALVVVEFKYNDIDDAMEDLAQIESTLYSLLRKLFGAYRTAQTKKAE